MDYRKMTFQNILDRALKMVSNDFDKRQASVIYDATASAAAELALAYVKMEYISKRLDVENLYENDLELFISDRTGIERREATKAIRKGVFSRANGSFFNLDIGSRFTVEDSYFIAIEKIADGEFKLECEKPGESGNMHTGKLLPVDNTNNLAKAELMELLTPGYDAESDLSLLTRYYEMIRTPPTSGNKYHYRNWAKEVPGVGEVKVVSLWAGDNTVKVVVVDSNMLPAEQGLIDNIQEYIDPGSRGLGEGQAPIGAFCTVVSAITKDIDISVSIVRDNSVASDTVLEEVRDNISKYFQEVTFKSNLISYAKIGATILTSKGVLDYKDLLVNEDTENIILEDEDAPVLEDVILNE